MFGQRNGISLVGVLIATAILSVVVVGALTSSTREAVWTRAAENRYNALLLARNMLLLVEEGPRRELRAAPKDGEGARVLSSAHTALPCGSLAIGATLFEWVCVLTKRGGFDVILRWCPNPRDTTSGTVPSVVKVLCRVEWKTEKGEARWVEMTNIVAP